jgi:hypothetical protein
VNNRQAAQLRPGQHIRRKGDSVVLVVEHVERATIRSDAVMVHAGGCAFRSWEIERVGLMQGWPRGGGEECG